MTKVQSRTSNRRGVTAVEFAIVAPIVLLMIFSILELARLMMFAGNVNTALLVGAREATLAESTVEDVEELIRLELRRFGIRQAEISFTPDEMTPTLAEVQIDIEVPINANNGLVVSQISNSTVSRSFSVNRESR